MSYIAIDLAIWERLVGAPLDEHGHPRLGPDGIPVNRCIPGLINTEPSVAEEAAGVVGPPPRPSYGVRIPMRLHSQHATVSGYRMPGMSHNGKRPPSLQNDFAPNNFVRIAVFPRNIEGLDVASIWPAVTFYYLDEAPNPAASPFGSHALVPTLDASDVTVNGVTGKDEVAYLPMGDAFDVTYAIRVYSKNDTELKLICDCVKRIFPQHTSLFVTQADGREVALSMSLVSVDNLDVYGRDVQRTLSGEAEFSRAFLYSISGRMDTSLALTGGGLGQDAATQDNVIVTRWLDLQQITATEIQRTFIYRTETQNG